MNEYNYMPISEESVSLQMLSGQLESIRVLMSLNR